MAVVPFDDEGIKKDGLCYSIRGLNCWWSEMSLEYPCVVDCWLIYSGVRDGIDYTNTVGAVIELRDDVSFVVKEDKTWDLELYD